MGGAGDPEHIVELFAGFGPVSVRRMFGGAGIFADGLMLGLVVDGVIFLKVDEADQQRFESEGLEPFRYPRKGSLQTINSFWRMPERLYDDRDELTDWARHALAAARRSAVRGASRTAPRPKGLHPKSKRAAKARRRPGR